MPDQIHVSQDRILEDTILPAGRPWSRSFKAGEYLRLVDLEGQQAIDFLCYDADDPLDRYNAANTIKLNGNIYLGKGSSLWSVRARKMMTIIEDSCGQHDTLGGCCSRESNALRYNVHDTQSCQDILTRELEVHGLGERDVVANINFFMYVPVSVNGDIAISDSRSKAGDYIDLRAEMNVLVVISNCPQKHNPACGFNPTPVRLIAHK